MFEEYKALDFVMLNFKPKAQLKTFKEIGSVPNLGLFRLGESKEEVMICGNHWGR